MAAGETSTCSSTWVTFAAHGANVVWASLQEPTVTRARKRVPGIFDVRLTKPGRRAVASRSSAVQKSVNMAIALRVHAVMEVSLSRCEDEHGNPSEHRGGTSPCLSNSISYRFR